MFYVGIEVIRGFLAFFFPITVAFSISFFLLLQWPILQLQIETRLNANFSLDFLLGVLVKFVEFKPVGFKLV